jgi:hypothetical protein
MTTAQSGMCRVTLGAIPYQASWSEGQVVFSCRSGFAGHNRRIVVEKRDPHGVLYVDCWDGLGGYVPASHIRQAVELAESVLGPDHFSSLEAARHYRRGPWLKLTHVGRWYDWRSGLVQVRGRTLLAWGVFARRRRFLTTQIS